jgi:hypothetical protein
MREKHDVRPFILLRQDQTTDALLCAISLVYDEAAAAGACAGGGDLSRDLRHLQ